MKKEKLMVGLPDTVKNFIRTSLTSKEAFVPGFLFALSCVLGRMLQKEGRTCRTLAGLSKGLLALIFMTIVSSVLVMLLFKGLSKLRDGRLKSRISGKEYSNLSVFLFYAGVILLCWIPVFLAYYPSVFAYDAEGQLYQVLAHDYSTHHPLLHTLFLGAFFNLGNELFHSYSAGMALHSAAQMLLMAGIFGWAEMVLYKERTSWVMRFILLAFYALFPANSVLALSTTKDVLFSGLTLLHMLVLYLWVQERCTGRRKIVTGYILLSVMMLLFRNNAVYAYLVSQPVVLFLWKKSGKTGWKQYMTAALFSLVFFAAGAAGLKAATGARNGSPREMLSVPLQQMARTRVMHEEEIEDVMREKLNAYLPAEWVFAAYNPHLADPVKGRAVIHDDPAGLIRTWAQLGVRFPLTYADAFLDNSIGYWYIADQNHAEIYGVGTESGFGYLSTDNRTMPAGCEIVEHSLAPGLRVFMERIVSDNEYRKIPVFSVIFSPAFYWWLLCFYIAFCLYRKEYKLLLPVLFLAVYYLTLLLSPTVLIRYMYPFVVSVPTMLCLISAKK